MSSFFSRLTSFAFGRESEELAAKQLIGKGYKILQKNFRCKGGEIDIIALDGDTLVFCEVKARRSKTFGSALEAITTSKVKKIKKAAEVFLLENNIVNRDCRFDVVAIDEDGGKREIKIIPNAF